MVAGVRVFVRQGARACLGSKLSSLSGSFHSGFQSKIGLGSCQVNTLLDGRLRFLRQNRALELLFNYPFGRSARLFKAKLGFGATVSLPFCTFGLAF